MSAPSLPLLPRFWSRVDDSGECWVWTGILNRPNGYGVLHLRGRVAIPAHRFSWELHNASEAPADMQVCHRCDNRRCVRPDHLFLGTQLDNTRDMDAKGRRRTNAKWGPVRRAAYEAWKRGGYAPRDGTPELTRDLVCIGCGVTFTRSLRGGPIQICGAKPCRNVQQKRWRQ